MSGWRLVRERARISDTVVAATAVLLAGACVIPLFVDLGWVASAVVMVVVVAALGAGSRALGMPLPFVPLAQALGLILTLTALYAAPLAWARILPTVSSWDALQSIARQGLVDAQAFQAPVPTFPGMVMLAVAALGLVALATDTLFVSVRSPLLAGLPLLATYVVTSALISGQVPWWTFPVCAAGWLLVLAADQRERVRDWGHLPGSTRIRGLSAGARRTGLVAIATAALVALLLPAAAGNPWGQGGSGGSGDGDAVAESADAVILSPLVSMRRSLLQANDTEVLTYRTQAPNPSYLRVTALETFDGTTWRQREGLESGRDEGVPLPGNVLSAFTSLDDSNRVRGGDSFTYDIDVSRLANAYLPLPYPVSQIDDVSGLGADWRLDPSTGVAFSDGIAASDLSYSVAALDPRIQSGQLRDAQAATGDFWPLLNLPGGLSPRITELAADLTRSAQTPYDKAVALQRWFTRDGGFTYSTDVRSGMDADYLAQFLDDRVGYCEQFAGAMAVMARTLGIPSRVVVGFTQGSQDEDGTWRVTVRDAHAWPELWFDGVGWARFEPTPRSGGTVLTPEYARTPAASAAGSEAIERRTPRDLDTVDAAGAGGPDLAGIVRTSVLVGLLIGGVALLVALALPMVRRVVRRRRRLSAREPVAVVEGAWAEVGDLAVDLGQPWSPFSTPRQAADRLARGMPEAPAGALRRLRQEVERVRYAEPVSGRMSAERAEAVRADLRIVTAELRGRVRWQSRLAAYCWPSSERRRQRSSMRSMNPPAAGGLGADGLAGASAAASAGRAPKAE